MVANGAILGDASSKEPTFRGIAGMWVLFRSDHAACSDPPLQVAIAASTPSLPRRAPNSSERLRASSCSWLGMPCG